MLVPQGDGKSVELQFAHYFGVRRQFAHPIFNFFARITVRQRKHRVFVAYCFKAFLPQVGADMLGRRLGVKHIGELRFQGLQTMHLLIELTVRESRHVQYVVLVVSLLQFLAQCFQFFALGFFYFTEKVHHLSNENAMTVYLAVEINVYDV